MKSGTDEVVGSNHHVELMPQVKSGKTSSRTTTIMPQNKPLMTCNTNSADYMTSDQQTLFQLLAIETLNFRSLQAAQVTELGESLKTRRTVDL